MDVLPAYPNNHGVDKKEDEFDADAEKRDIMAGQVQDAFGSEEDAEIKYKTLTWCVVGMLISMVLSIPRTMKGMTWVSFASFLSIFGAVMITMISVGVQDHPNRVIHATVETNLYTGFQAVSNIVFAYCAHVAFFGLIAEMENPKDFNKSLLMLQSFEICLYLTAAVVIYYYVGTDVASPALTSAGPVMKKVAYGIAIPTVRTD
ncbi:unnamed protein product [Aspergillus oryzae]|uniref:Unnamed protein product n=2 Tax=Aspergillus oryzae TaxID=5062 RepID=A0AAN5C5I9_ASPOZ|nr:unnamed protein product [Aspergillus oryzae]GMG16256.1 unnamed protein product [Aspergillus oryzae]GMG39052.1 unnamed protein product [Aspergillus oryzae]GMG52741.1 unnamed protein product [Aspergillus oryzae var. brunneus]